MRSGGQYQKQLTDYFAFIPCELPLNPPVEIDSEMQKLLSKADRALGRLDGSLSTLPNADLFIFMYVRKEAELSSQIEGTQASIGDVLKAEANIFSADAPDDVGEILNYVGALNHGLDRLKTLPVSLRLFREIHGILMRNVRGADLQPGEFRTSQNWIGVAGSTLRNANYVPPPPQILQELLGSFEKFLHESDDIPPLIKIGVAHAYFETLHPFLDGNGRLGRLLITFLLCEKEILIKPALYLSTYFKAHREAYYDLLQKTRDDGDYESWIKFFLMGVCEVSNQSTQKIREIVGLRESHRDLLTNKLNKGAANGQKVLEKLYTRPIVKVNDIIEWTGVTSPAAHNLVSRLVELGILTEITGQTRNRAYSYKSYLDLFY